METARTALVGYALGHRGARSPGHLPCPDTRTPGLSGVANDGREDRLPDGRCAVASGNLPWLSLGLAEGDAWGNRLGYAVAPVWSLDGDAAAPPGNPAPGNTLLQVCLEPGCASPLPAAAVLISHGRNGFGARQCRRRASTWRPRAGMKARTSTATPASACFRPAPRTGPAASSTIWSWPCRRIGYGAACASRPPCARPTRPR
jgi:hypothetical protein